MSHGGPRLINTILKLLENIWEPEVLQAEWNEAIVYPIHKKGDKGNLQNYTTKRCI